MYFSITFGEEPETKNTWEDWKLIPATPPMIEAPEPNLNMVEIPGRAAGPIDLSKYPFGKITYQRVSGSWNFLTEPEGHDQRVALYESIRRWLHGRTTRIVLEEDPTHFYKGIFTVTPISTGSGPNQITISYNLEPVRYNVLDDTTDSSWVSDWS